MRAHFGLPSVRGGVSFFLYVQPSPSRGNWLFLLQIKRLTNERQLPLNMKFHILLCQGSKFDT
jgi:hypothetical protein